MNDFFIILFKKFEKLLFLIISFHFLTTPMRFLTVLTPSHPTGSEKLKNFTFRLINFLKAAQIAKVWSHFARTYHLCHFHQFRRKKSKTLPFPSIWANTDYASSKIALNLVNFFNILICQMIFSQILYKKIWKNRLFNRFFFNF